MRLRKGFALASKHQPQSWDEFKRIAEKAAREAKPKRKVSNAERQRIIENTEKYRRPGWTDPDESGTRCAHVSKKTGKQCGRHRMHGATRCSFHGGYRENPHHPATIRAVKAGRLEKIDLENKSAAALYAHRDLPEYRKARAACEQVRKSAGIKYKLNYSDLWAGMQAFVSQDAKAWQAWAKAIMRGEGINHAYRQVL